MAEAKRQARRHRLAVAAVIFVGALAVSVFARWDPAGATADAATTGSGKQCTRSSSYGSQCIRVLGSGRRVAAVETWFDATGMFWPNERWRVDLEAYVCDPIGKTKATCSATTTWHGEIRTGARVVDGRAEPPHLGQSQSNGYWPTLVLPHRFRSNVWLCTEVAVYNAARKRWVYNAAGLDNGLRACVSVRR